MKVDINVSWSPISQESLKFIIENASNTNAISLHLSPHTYYRISDSTKALATSKNINLVLLEGNYTEDTRWKLKADKSELPTHTSQLVNDSNFAKTIPIVTQTDSIVTIQPNVYNQWGEIERLEITLEAPEHQKSSSYQGGKIFVKMKFKLNFT